MKRRQSKSLFERWAAKVGPQTESGCWPWTGAVRGKGGRGAIGIGDRACWAYRVGYELLVGPVPAGMSVCHRCDNPNCVAPHHLFIGTHAENMHDAQSKGRLRPPAARYGADHPLSKLHSAAGNVRMLAVLGASQRDIADWLGVSQTAIGHLLRGETHKEKK